MLPGLFIGVLIGVISGMVTLLLLRTATGASIKEVKAIIAITAEFLAIPTFWFGGPWVTTALLNLVPLTKFLNPYIISLTISYLIIVFYPIFRWIIKFADDL